MTVTQDERRNGVDVPTLFATLDAVGRRLPELADFRFRARNTWAERNAQPYRRSWVLLRRRAGGHQPRRGIRLNDADHPTILVGSGRRPHPGGVPVARGSPHA